MNPQDYEISDRTLDRLVDGELSEAESQRLLRALDAQQGGWKQCALAFLEAQAWGHAMSGAPIGTDASVSERPLMLPPSNEHPLVQTQREQRGPSAHVPGGWFSIAGALLLAFGLGVFSERQWLYPDHSERLALESPGTDLGDPPTAGLTLVVNDGLGGTRQLDLPVVDSQAGLQWLDQRESLEHEISVREMLRRNGQIVSKRERFVAPVETADGQRFLVPVERWRVEPTTNRNVQ